MEINLLKAMNHPNIVNHPQRAHEPMGPGALAAGPPQGAPGPLDAARAPGPMEPWALWGWLTMFGWFIAFSKLISIYLSRYILLYMDRYKYPRSVLEVRTRRLYSTSVLDVRTRSPYSEVHPRLSSQNSQFYKIYKIMKNIKLR